MLYNTDIHLKSFKIKDIYFFTQILVDIQYRYKTATDSLSQSQWHRKWFIPAIIQRYDACHQTKISLFLKDNQKIYDDG